MKKSIGLIFAFALVLILFASAKADTLTQQYSLTWSTNNPENAQNVWAPFTVTSNTPIPDLSSYTPTSLTLTLDVIDPSATWKIEVGSSTIQVSETGYSYTNYRTDSGLVTFNLLSNYPADFNNSGFNWYDSSINFSAWASGCHIIGATYTVQATTATPEPSTILLLGLGLAGAAMLGMKFRTASTVAS